MSKPRGPYRVDPLGHKKSQQALDKKAENARELGLDYKPAQHKPVAWTLLLVGEHNGLVGKAGEKFIGHPEHYERVDVYTSPPAQRKPLTDEQIDRLWSQSLADTESETWLPLREFARAIEAAHGIKENT